MLYAIWGDTTSSIWHNVMNVEKWANKPTSKNVTNRCCFITEWHFRERTCSHMDITKNCRPQTNGYGNGMLHTHIYPMQPTQQINIKWAFPSASTLQQTPPPLSNAYCYICLNCCGLWILTESARLSMLATYYCQVFSHSVPSTEWSRPKIGLFLLHWFWCCFCFSLIRYFVSFGFRQRTKEMQIATYCYHKPLIYCYRINLFTLDSIPIERMDCWRKRDLNRQNMHNQK